MATRKSSSGFETPSNGDPGEVPENTGGESPAEFESVILKRSGDSIVRFRDIGWGPILAIAVFVSLRVQ